MKLLQKIGGLACLLSASVALAADCESVAASVTKQVEAAPEKVLMVIEDAMASHEKCACEVVKAAIVASKANEKLVGEIVFTAVIASESMAPTVAECAISVAPDSASQIRSALKRALSDTGYTYDGGKSPVSGKSSYGKDPIPSAEPVDDGGFDFGRAPLDVRGIYLLAPSPGGGFASTTQDFDIPRALAREFKRIFGFFPQGIDRDEVVNLINKSNKQSESSGGRIIIEVPVSPSDPKPKDDKK